MSEKESKNQDNQDKVRENLEKDAHVKYRTRKKSTEKKIFWITRSIADEIGREEVLKRTLIEFVIFASFLTLATIYIIGINTTSVYYLTKALKQQFLGHEFRTLNDMEITFEDIKTAADVWFYLENHMINNFFWESTYDLKAGVDENAMNILYENKMLGVPRLRQVKVRNDSCTIHSYFRKLFLSCYDAYSKKAEDRKVFGPASDTAWIYSCSEETKSLSYWGEISTYDGGGFYVNLARNKTKSIEIIKNLKENIWIRRGTRAIFVDFSVYNPNLNIFGVCKLIFEFPTTGGVLPSANFQSVRLLRFHTQYDTFILICQGCCYLFIFYYVLEEIREIVYYKLQYFTRFWNYMDLSIIALFLIAAVISIHLIIQVPKAIQTIKHHPEEYGNLEHVTHLYNKHNDVVAVALFFIYLKVFKFLNFNRTMGQLNNTLNKCALDILGFSLMFFIIFFAYAELGYLLFGDQVEGFSSFNIAMFTLLRTILGDFDYQEIETAHRILAPFYFLSYIFLVFFVLLNMFLAIINDTYSDVKTEIALAPHELQMTEYLNKLFRNIVRKMGCGRYLSHKTETKDEINATLRQIRDVLKKCGFSDIEIEMFFTRYNIDPLIETLPQDTEQLITGLNNILTQDNLKDNDYVKLKDFVSQQDRLVEIEKVIGDLVRLVRDLMVKLENVEI